MHPPEDGSLEQQQFELLKSSSLSSGDKVVQQAGWVEEDEKDRMLMGVTSYLDRKVGT